jgi:hypothetical protein
MASETIQTKRAAKNLPRLHGEQVEWVGEIGGLRRKL